ETVYPGIYLRRSYVDLSQLHLRQARTTQAIADLDKAIERTQQQMREQTVSLSTNSLERYFTHFDLVPLLSQIASLLIKERQYTEAIRRLDAGIALVRKHPHAHQPAYVDIIGSLQIWRGLACAHAGDHRSAAANAAAAGSVRGDSEAKYNLA